MNETFILQNLEAIAEKLQIKVQYESLRKKHVFSRGGLCKLKDDNVIIIETSLHLSEKIDVLADALSQFDLEGIYMPPAVRKILSSKSNKETSDDKEKIELPEDMGPAG